MQQIKKTFREAGKETSNQIYHWAYKMKRHKEIFTETGNLERNQQTTFITGHRKLNELRKLNFFIRKKRQFQRIFMR